MKLQGERSRAKKSGRQRLRLRTRHRLSAPTAPLEAAKTVGEGKATGPLAAGALSERRTSMGRMVSPSQAVKSSSSMAALDARTACQESMHRHHTADKMQRWLETGRDRLVGSGDPHN